jgi:hypothetical protein
MDESEPRTIELDYCFYSPRDCRRRNGVIEIRGSCYSREGGHASLDISVGPVDSDYDFWLWLVPQLPFLEFEALGDKDLKNLQARFDAEMRSEGRPTREELLDAVPRCPPTRMADVLFSVIERATCCILAVVVVPLVFVVQTASGVLDYLRGLFGQRHSGNSSSRSRVESDDAEHEGDQLPGD